MKKKLKIIGLMSGTSADGINASIIETDYQGEHLKIIDHKEFPFPKELQRSINDVSVQGHGSSDLICHLNFLLADRFAKAAIRIVKEAGLSMDQIDLIGSHGQTIYHIPVEIKGKKEKDERYGYRMPSTLQIGDGSFIAEKTEVTTVSDFRTRDIAAGGEGAPLTPYGHFILFGNNKKSVAINNLGGISNVTYLKKGGTPDDIIAFDTGPGNMLIDGIMFLLTEGKRNYDMNGSMAKKGKPDELFIRKMMQNPYLSKKPPKSTGREEFGLDYAKTILNHARMKYIAPADLIASITSYTARTISLGYRKFIMNESNTIDEAIFCGGGINNKTLMSMISDSLSPITVKTSEDYGIPSSCVESVSFALLALAAVTGKPANIPSATGAKKSTILGKISPAQNYQKFNF